MLGPRPRKATWFHRIRRDDRRFDAFTPSYDHRSQCILSSINIHLDCSFFIFFSLSLFLLLNSFPFLLSHLFSVCLSLSVSLSVSLCLFCLSVCLFLSLSVSVSLCLSVSVSLCLSVCLSLSLPLSLSLSLFLSLFCAASFIFCTRYSIVEL